MFRSTFNAVKTISAFRTPVLSNVRKKSAYSGDGKTTIRVMNQDIDSGLMIDSYGTYGFRLNNGVTVLGPMAIFAKNVLSWQVESGRQVTAQSLLLFKLLQPKIDLLIVGVEREDHNAVMSAARPLRINVELLTAEHACATFNFLNAESRSVAAAIIPPTVIDRIDENDMMQASLHYDSPFIKDHL